MRYLLIAALLIAPCASAAAQTFHRGKASMVHPRAQQRVIAPPGPGASSPARFSVPGWTDEQTRQWLDNATSCEGCG